MIVGGLCSMSVLLGLGLGSCQTCGPLQFSAPYYGPRSAVVQMSLFDFDTGPVPPMAVSCNQFASYQFPQELRVFYSSFDLLLLRLVPVRSRQFIYFQCYSFRSFIFFVPYLMLA